MSVMVLALAAPAWSADPPKPAAPLTEEQVVEQFRGDLMAKKADIMAKGLTLTSDQAAKFWPLFETYQKEQDQIVNEQIKATQYFADHYATLSDQEALDYVTALLGRDKKTSELRAKWLTKFQGVLGGKLAARAIQLDRRLSQVNQVQISSRIPLVR